MDAPSPEARYYFDEAIRYEEVGDFYHAVKLYKRTIREAPGWAAPCLRLGHFYKYRQEWKPSLYYSKKGIAADAGNQQAWWDVGIAATALGKGKLARRVWDKFGGSARLQGLVSARIKQGRSWEIVGVQRRGPASGVVRSVPHPKSQRRYGDLILLDNIVQGHHISGAYRLPVYEELGLLKRSHFVAFSCQLLLASTEDVNLLHQLCADKLLGFEVWGNASRTLSWASPEGQATFYHQPLTEQPPALLVAIAARRESQAQRVLQDWSVITLKSFDGFQAHH